ncbi:MAG: hypothetical protein ACKODH_10195 [Limisphaerales bacterium]
MQNAAVLLALALALGCAEAALVEIPDRVRRWQSFPDCVLVPTKFGDGDSFRVKLGDGR